MPSLVRFYDEHATERDRFVILAFHDASVKDLTELDTHLNSIVKHRWSDRALPFPILLDSTGKTIETWGVNSFPTTVLIDPAGKIVGEAGIKELEEALKRTNR